MTLSAGTKLGPYEIQTAIGAGGMGEVYRARDTRLERTVAIKVLAAHLTSSPELKLRFEQEARSISSLNHANICHLYDIGSQNGTDFLVMEFLEGETLAERLRRGPLPMSELLKNGIEVAQALEVAHRAGIIHRDLKPANIMLTKSGAKLMDFGLAKPSAMGAAASGSAPLLSAARTVSGPSPMSPITTAGSIVGTIQYMSPEQIEGQPADARSDIFAFGAVLYEMATGKRTFEGKSQISVASAILEKDPEPISAVAPLTPATFEHVVRRALEKNPDDRWQTASDVRGELKWIAEGGSQIVVPAAAGKSPARRDRLAWAIAAVFLLLAAVAGVAYWKSATRSEPTIATTILPPPGANFTLSSLNGPPAISPDGTMVAFIAMKDGVASVWVRNLSAMQARQMPGTEGAFAPFWSPDSRYIAYFTAGKLQKMLAQGGPPQTICEAADARGGSWGSSDEIIFAPSRVDSIYKVSASGGTPVQVTQNTKDYPTGPSSHRWPWFLPDGKHFLYVATPTGSQAENAEIRFASLDGGNGQQVLVNSSNPEYDSGRLLYEQDGTVMSAPFDASSGKITGEGTPVAQSVQYDANYVQGSYAVSPSGLLVYETGVAALNRQLTWFDHAGKQTGVLGESAFYGSLRLSPDGTRLAVVVVAASGNGRDIWIFDIARGIRTRLTFGQGLHVTPIWSPDGKYVYYLVPTQGIFRKAADGSGQDEQLLSTTKLGALEDISPDGKYLTASADANIMVVPLTGDIKATPYQPTSFHQSNSAFSRDGKWLAYQSDESGRQEVYISSFPQPGSKWQVSSNGGVSPDFSGDGKTIYYVSSSTFPRDMMAVRVDMSGNAAHIGAPEKLFALSPFIFGWDVTRDGRFIINESSQQSSPEPLTLVTNWTAGLKK